MAEVDLNDINAFNMKGYAFGTSFPRYSCLSPKDGNRLVETMEIPINYYEPRYDGVKFPDDKKIRSYIDDGAKYGRICQFFIHPHYFCTQFGNDEAVHGAIDVIKAYCREKNYAVWKTTTDNIAKYWKARSESNFKFLDNGEIELEISSPMVLILPECCKGVKNSEGELEIKEKTVSGKTCRAVSLQAKGKYLIYK
ncbi:MAG: hypothetical protein E7623_05285 [Ruminococcaceae bacterium]|nr:hypothetical protein [Oscillospiraceae bacterium]